MRWRAGELINPGNISIYPRRGREVLSCQKLNQSKSRKLKIYGVNSGETIKSSTGTHTHKFITKSLGLLGRPPAIPPTIQLSSVQCGNLQSWGTPLDIHMSGCPETAVPNHPERIMFVDLVQ